ncbi:MAG: UPF0147 family protein [archaeon]|nr:UPF0147 family protein [archaeon]
MNSTIQDAIDCLKVLQEETDISKKFRERMSVIINILNSNEELFIEKALNELDELNSLDIPSYHRTQVWDIISLLESCKR